LYVFNFKGEEGGDSKQKEVYIVNIWFRGAKYLGLLLLPACVLIVGINAGVVVKVEGRFNFDSLDFNSFPTSSNRFRILPFSSSLVWPCRDKPAVALTTKTIQKVTKSITTTTQIVINNQTAP
jgi:hypothetical protein